MDPSEGGCNTLELHEKAMGAAVHCQRVGDAGSLFSIMAVSSSLDDVRQRLSALLSRSERPSGQHALALSWAEFDALLPDGGLPHGVVELTAPLSLGGGTMVALAAIRAAQSKDSGTWCAWIDPTRTLYAPGVVMAGVQQHRLIIVRPPASEVGRIAVKVARSRSFAVIVVDGDAVGGAAAVEDHRRGSRPRDARSQEVLARRLALLAAEGGSTILLLTDSRTRRSAPLPVALRLELERAPDAIQVRVGKDRYGRGGLAKTVPLQDRPSLHLAG